MSIFVKKRKEQLDTVSRLNYHIGDSLVLAKRNLVQIPRIPSVIVFAFIQPVMFMVLFSFVFGHGIDIPGGGDYKEFLVPGIFVQTIAFAGASTSVGITYDMSLGLIDRYRSLPMSRAAVLAGRTISDAFRGLLTLLILAGIGLLIGWEMRNGVLSTVLAFALILLFGYSMSWVGVTIGLFVEKPEVAQTAGLVWLFPLTFVSTIFIPSESIAPFLQPIVQWNPLSMITYSIRDLFGNPNPIISGNSFPEQYPILVTVLWCVLILAIFVPLGVRRYRVANLF